MSCDSQSPCTARGERRGGISVLEPQLRVYTLPPSYPYIYLNDVQDVHVEVLHREGIALGHTNHELVAILEQQVLLCLELALTLEEN